MAFSEILGVTNETFWDLARKMSPSFKSHTAKATADLFTERGFEAVTRSGVATLNEFFELSLRVAFQLLNVTRARNPLAGSGLVEVFDNPYGGITQRMSIGNVKPLSPAYLNIKNGDSIDPFVVNKAPVSERFFNKNFEYQALVTIPDDFQVRQIFISPYGVGEFVSGILSAMEAAYTVQEYENTKEAMNAALNSTVAPLQDTQKYVLGSWTDAAPTDAELKAFILAIKSVAAQMASVSQTGAYNAAGYVSRVELSDYVLLLRAGTKAAIDVQTLVGAFNPDYLSFPFESVEIDNFGGLIPYVEASGEEVELTPNYDDLGQQIGYKDESGTTYTEDEVEKKDPNDSVIAALVQKGAFFETSRNAYEVEPIRNPRGRYNNYWASRPGTTIAYDSYYNFVTFSKPSTVSP